MFNFSRKCTLMEGKDSEKDIINRATSKKKWQGDRMLSFRGV